MTTIYIDESGSFSYTGGESYVGGWVVQNLRENEIYRRLNLMVTSFNENEEVSKDKALKYPDDLHFVPLHIPAMRQKKRDREISVPPELVPKFMESVFNTFEEYVLYAFRSIGRPAVIANNHAAYVDVLLNTLVQLIDTLVQDGNQKIELVIARRRGWYGLPQDDEAKIDNTEYENYLGNSLVRVLQSGFVGRKPEFSIAFEDARKHPGLILADFFCGAIGRRAGTNYLLEYDCCKCKKFRHEDGYRLTANRQATHLQEMASDDPAGAALQTLEVLGGAQGNQELENLLRKILSGFTEAEWQQFSSLLARFLEDKLVEDPNRYDNLDWIGRTILSLRKAIKNSSNLPPRVQSQLESRVAVAELRIASHRGQVTHDTPLCGTDTMNGCVPGLFDNLLEAFRFQIDIVLSAVQVTAFNKLRFEEAEKDIDPLIKRYEKMFSNELSTEGVKDELFAKLCGTYGQLCGFVYDLCKEELYFDLAAEYLQKDLRLCHEGSAAWHQGAGYLTSLYWKKGHLDQAIDQLAIECGLEMEYNQRQILDLSDSSLLSDLTSPYERLHHIQLCALAQQNEWEVQDVESTAEQLRADPKIAEYPKLQIAKWLAVMLMHEEKYGEAHQLLNLALQSPNPDFTIRVVQLPLQMLAHVCRRCLNKRSAFSLVTALNDLEGMEQGSGDILNAGGLGNYNEGEEDWDAYGVATALPYYFS